MISSRRGIGSLHVRIGGLGRRASTETRGGASPEPGDITGIDFLRKSPLGLWLIVICCFANSCCRLAYVSSLGFPLLGGSMGRKLKPAICQHN